MAQRRRRRRSGDAATPLLRALPGVPPASDDRAGETAIDGLLGEVRDLRLTLSTDLSAAAGAAEAGADDVALDIIEADRRELARFLRVADLRLSRLQGESTAASPMPLLEPAAFEDAPAAAPRWRRRVAMSLPAIPLVGAMALSAAAATGVLPLPGSTSTPTRPAHVATVIAPTESAATPVDSAFEQFETLVDGYPSASQVLAAAAVLHRQLVDLIAASPHDPTRVQEVVQLLRAEQSLLLRRQPPGTPIVLAAARQLAVRLVQVATPRASSTTSPFVLQPSPDRAQRPARTSPAPASTKSAPTQPTSSPAPAPAPSAPGTPAPTASPSAPTANPIPNLPN